MELFRPIRSKRRIVAIALLILMLVGGTTVAAEPFIRWLQNFYIEQNEDHVVVQNNELDESVEHTKENFRKYRLTEVPEGYSLKSETFEEDFQRYQIIYSSVEDRGISSLIVSNGVYKLVLDGKFSKEELKNVVSKLELDNQPIE